MGDFNTPLTAMDRSTRQKINKETQALNDTLKQMDLIDTYRTFHPKATEYTFFPSAHGTFSKIGTSWAIHQTCHLASLNLSFLLFKMETCLLNLKVLSMII